jgi:peptidoglycan-associated lipoprotein
VPRSQRCSTKATCDGIEHANRLAMRHLAILAIACAACSHNTVVKTADSQGITTTTTSTTSNGSPGHDVVVSDELARACNLHFSNVQQAPKFDYDQAALLPDDESTLDQIAECVTTGPLKGRGVHLVGRADARGEVEYNLALGASRSTIVKQFLSRHGVDGSRISTTSRGKLDATGTDEDSWRQDRRVDVMLN